METFDYWRERLGIAPGMSKAEALKTFLEWKENKRTCERCGGEALVDFCPIRLICREADKEVLTDERRTKDRTTNLRKEFSRGVGSLKVKPIRIKAKGASLDKPGK